MTNKNKKTYVSKKPFWFIFILTIVAIIFIVSITVFSVQYKKYYLGLPAISDIHKSWEEGDYADVYEKTSLVLVKRPFDYDILAVHGFSAYYLFEEQTDLSIGYNYISEAIVSLRKALYYGKTQNNAKIYYILGKSYYQKGFFYADLALKYLDKAYETNEYFPDLAEFRGMSASLLNLPEKAISAFITALEQDPSDLVLFALAKNYIKIEDTDNAKMYLTETINKTQDVLLEIDARALLGNILLAENKIEKAKDEYMKMLEKNKNSADAYFGLGLIYEKQGDLVKARAEWRKALKLDPLHINTRNKLKL